MQRSTTLFWWLIFSASCWIEERFALGRAKPVKPSALHGMTRNEAFSVPFCTIDSGLPLPDRAQRAQAPGLAGLAFTGCRTRMQHLESQYRKG